MRYRVPVGTMVFRYGHGQFSNKWHLFQTTRDATFTPADVMNVPAWKRLTGFDWKSLGGFEKGMNVPNEYAFAFFQLPPSAHPWFYIAVPKDKIRHL